MYIQTQTTPNPNALQFLPEVKTISKEPVYFNNIEEAVQKSQLAVKLFKIKDVEAVFFGEDFITITKSESSDWQVLKPEILMEIMDHLTSGLPIFDDQQNLSKINTDGMSDIEKEIVEIIETRVRPSVAMDGGDIVYQGFKDGVVYLQLRGACSGCPSASITLKNGIESMLQHFVPEVKSVEAVEE